MQIRKNLLLVALAAVALVAGVAATFGENFVKALESFDSKRAAAIKAGSLKKEDIDKLHTELLETVEWSSITLDEINQLNSRGVFAEPKLLAKVTDTLAKASEQKTVEGAYAAALRLPIVTGYRFDGSQVSAEERNKLIEGLLNHPNLEELAMSKYSSAAMNALAAVPAKSLEPKKDLITKMSSSFSSPSKEQAMAASSYWGLVKKVTQEGDERQSIREKISQGVASYLKSSTSSDLKDNERSYLNDRFIPLINGAHARGKLVGFEAPGVTFKWSSIPGVKSLADLKGKVVVVDFWATWCGPCIASFPMIREAQAHYKGYDVVVLGITSIQGAVYGLDEKQPKIDLKDDPQKEMDLMTPWMKNKEVTWDVAFSHQDVFNPEFGVNGIPSMAIIDATGKVRYAGLHPAAVSKEKKIEMIDGLLKEAGLKTPPAK